MMNLQVKKELKLNKYNDEKNYKIRLQKLEGKFKVAYGDRQIKYKHLKQSWLWGYIRPKQYIRLSVVVCKYACVKDTW